MPAPTREQWLTARLELPAAEKEHTRRRHLANHDVVLMAISETGPWFSRHAEYPAR